MKRLVECFIAVGLTVAGAAALAAPGAPLSPNEAAGLPDLDQVNGTVTSRASASSKVELNEPQQPSFHIKDTNGTEITEYRTRGKPTEIDVRSGFGTRYRMTDPLDVSPAAHNPGMPSGRLPAIHLSY